MKLEASLSFMSLKFNAKRIVKDHTATCIPTYKNCATMPFLNAELPDKYLNVSINVTWDLWCSSLAILHFGNCVIRNKSATAIKTKIRYLYGCNVCSSIESLNSCICSGVMPLICCSKLAPSWKIRYFPSKIPAIAPIG